MVSSSNDIHPTSEGKKLRDHVISSGAHGCKDGRLRGELPLSQDSIAFLALNRHKQHSLCS